MLKHSVILGSTAALALALSACGDSGEDTEGAEMTTDQPAMTSDMEGDTDMATDQEDTMGEGGAMSDGSAASASGGSAASAGSGAAGTAAKSGTTATGAAGSGAMGGADDRIGSQPSGDANIPTPNPE